MAKRKMFVIEFGYYMFEEDNQYSIHSVVKVKAFNEGYAHVIFRGWFIKNIHPRFDIICDYNIERCSEIKVIKNDLAD